MDDQLKTKLLTLTKTILPSAKLSDDPSDFVFEDDCGCYSEFTTDPCRLYFGVNADGATVKDRESVERLIRAYAHANLTWSGCDCCDNELSIWVRIYPED